MPGQAPDPTGAKILDAASRVLVDFGVKRATVELVAKYAGVSHMTVYRRWSSKNDLLRFATLSELNTVLDTAFAAAAEREPFGEKVIHAFAAVVWAVRNHPLTVRLVNTEPEVLLSLLSAGSSSVMDAAVPLVAEHLQRLAPDDTDTADLNAVADVFVRMAHSLVAVEPHDQPLTSPRSAEEYARRCFNFLVEPDPVVPLAPPPRQRAPLVAASLLAVLLIGGGLGATLARGGDAVITPSLIRTEQAPTSAASSSTPAAPSPPPAPAGISALNPPATPSDTTPPSTSAPAAAETVPTPVTNTPAPTPGGGASTGDGQPRGGPLPPPRTGLSASPFAPPSPIGPQGPPRFGTAGPGSPPASGTGPAGPGAGSGGHGGGGHH